MNRLTEKRNGIYVIDSDYYNENTNIRLTGVVVDKLAEYENLEEQLINKYHELKNKIDSNDTTGFKNGQIELLEQILKINDPKECIS